MTNQLFPNWSVPTDLMSGVYQSKYIRLGKYNIIQQENSYIINDSRWYGGENNYCSYVTVCSPADLAPVVSNAYFFEEFFTKIKI